MTLPKFSGLIVAACLSLCACGGSGDEPAPDTQLASATTTSGDAQTGEVGTELSQSLEARLFNTSGTPLSGKAVNFVVSGSHGGSVSTSTTPTVSDADGYVRGRWKLGTVAGLQTLDVQAVNESGTTVTYATFTATALRGVTTSIVAVEGASQSGPQGQPLPMWVKVRTSDQYGNPTRVMITFAAQDGGSTGIQNVITDLDGSASVNWTLGPTPGVQHLTATAEPLSPNPKVSILVTATAAP